MARPQVIDVPHPFVSTQLDVAIERALDCETASGFVTVGHPGGPHVLHPAMGPAQCPEGRRIPSYPDGNCLYAGCVGAYDVARYMNGRDDRGALRRPVDPLRERSDKSHFLDFKGRMIEAAQIAGDWASVEHLRKTGSAGYPASQHIKYAAIVVGGKIHEVHVENAQHPIFSHGTGPVAFCLAYRLSIDGSGHRADHWELAQSWMVPSEYRCEGGP